MPQTRAACFIHGTQTSAPTAAPVALLAALVLGLPASAATERPILRLAATAPLAVEGRGFVGAENVQLVAVGARAQQTRTVVASKKGRLRVRFQLRARRCEEVTVRAVGSLGSRAVLHREGDCKKRR
ncbi:MAG: hypothetical protein H0W14_01760 [Actinobacteria bacterium]|nr:hypothetical protein [Actinomycetota bacterium]